MTQEAPHTTPGGHRVRIGFEIDGTVRPVVWFEPRGNDVYWGSPSPGRSPGSSPMVVEGGRTSISIPLNLDHIEPQQSKFSYHESGQIHVKRAGVIDGEIGRVTPSAALQVPICLGTLITKKAELYKAGRGLQRGGAAALLLRLEGGAERVRHYFEFFLSPEGTFDLPPMLLAPHVTDHHIVFTQSMSSHVILAIRHLQCGQEFSDTAPDVEIWTHLHKLATDGE